MGCNASTPISDSDVAGSSVKRGGAPAQKSGDGDAGKAPPAAVANPLVPTFAYASQGGAKPPPGPAPITHNLTNTPSFSCSIGPSVADTPHQHPRTDHIDDAGRPPLAPPPTRISAVVAHRVARQLHGMPPTCDFRLEREPQTTSQCLRDPAVRLRVGMREMQTWCLSDEGTEPEPDSPMPPPPPPA